MYSKKTKKINITVNPYFLDDQSEPDDQHFVWAYQVTIDNQSNEKVQLKNRYWKIIDSNGSEQEVRGEGVVGKKPLISPGESFRYTSWVSIKTPIGTMEGSYTMTSRSNNLEDVTEFSEFEVPIPVFSIQQLKVLH